MKKLGEAMASTGYSDTHYLWIYFGLGAASIVFQVGACSYGSSIIYGYHGHLVHQVIIMTELLTGGSFHRLPGGSLLMVIIKILGPNLSLSLYQ